MEQASSSRMRGAEDPNDSDIEIIENESQTRCVQNSELGGHH